MAGGGAGGGGGLDKAERIVNYDFDRHAPGVKGMVGAIHLAKAYSPEVPKELWKARRGWRYDRKKAKQWAVLEKGADLAVYGFCGRCMGADN